MPLANNRALVVHPALLLLPSAPPLMPTAGNPSPHLPPSPRHPHPLPPLRPPPRPAVGVAHAGREARGARRRGLPGPGHQLRPALHRPGPVSAEARRWTHAARGARRRARLTPRSDRGPLLAGGIFQFLFFTETPGHPPTPTKAELNTGGELHQAWGFPLSSFFIWAKTGWIGHGNRSPSTF